jgi:hypothetical protein
MPTMRPPIEPPTAAPVASFLLIVPTSAETLAAAAAAVDALLANSMTAGSFVFKGCGPESDRLALDDPDDDVDDVDDVSRALGVRVATDTMSLYCRTSAA